MIPSTMIGTSARRGALGPYDPFRLLESLCYVMNLFSLSTFTQLLVAAEINNKILEDQSSSQ